MLRIPVSLHYPLDFVCWGTGPLTAMVCWGVQARAVEGRVRAERPPPVPPLGCPAPRRDRGAAHPAVRRGWPVPGLWRASEARQARGGATGHEALPLGADLLPMHQLWPGDRQRVAERQQRRPPLD